MDTRAFLENYQVTDIEKDPLPIKVLRNSIIKEEIAGQALHWGFDYLDQRSCPLGLIIQILQKLHQEVVQTDFSHCAEAAGDSIDGSNPLEFGTKYEPLKLMRAVVKILDEICLKEKEDFHDSVDGTIEAPDMQPHVFAVSYNNIKNSRRFMEDRMTILPRMDRIFKLPEPVSYFAVFDGHNGSEAAAYGAAQLHQYLIHGINQQQDVITSIGDAFECLDEVFIQKCRSGKVKSGSTAVLCLLMPNKLYVAWVGDSQAVLVKRDEINNLVIPHKPDRKDEIDRIKSNGGEVIQMNGTYRVNGNLAVSRAIGDADDKQFIISTPDIKMLELDGSEEFLIIACDGLWDEISPEAAAQIVRRQVVVDPSNISGISQNLIVQAKERGSTDNISVIVVFLEALESIKNRYEGQLTENSELDMSILKSPIDSIGLKPSEELIENTVHSPDGFEINGHGKDIEQAVDFISFGSSRESGAQLISDDTGNQSGDDDNDKKDEEVEELISDAESDDDEWQFEKPTDHNATVTNIITGNGIGDNMFGTDIMCENVARLNIESPAEHRDSEETITIVKDQPSDTPSESLNPFVSESKVLVDQPAGIEDQNGNPDPDDHSAVIESHNEAHDMLQLDDSKAANGESVFDNTFILDESHNRSESIPSRTDEGVISEQQVITEHHFIPEQDVLPKQDPMAEPVIENILEPTNIVNLGGTVSSVALISDFQEKIENYNPFDTEAETVAGSFSYDQPAFSEGMQSGADLPESLGQHDLLETEQKLSSGNPFGFDPITQPLEEPTSNAVDAIENQVEKSRPDSVEVELAADNNMTENHIEVNNFGTDEMEYLAQVETNPIPEGLIEESERISEFEDQVVNALSEGSSNINPFSDEMIPPRQENAGELVEPAISVTPILKEEPTSPQQNPVDLFAVDMEPQQTTNYPLQQESVDVVSSCIQQEDAIKSEDSVPSDNFPGAPFVSTMEPISQLQGFSLQENVTPDAVEDPKDIVPDSVEDNMEDIVPDTIGHMSDTVPVTIEHMGDTVPAAIEHKEDTAPSTTEQIPGVTLSLTENQTDDASRMIEQMNEPMEDIAPVDKPEGENLALISEAREVLDEVPVKDSVDVLLPPNPIEPPVSPDISHELMTNGFRPDVNQTEVEHLDAIPESSNDSQVSKDLESNVDVRVMSPYQDDHIDEDLAPKTPVETYAQMDDQLVEHFTKVESLTAAVEVDTKVITQTMEPLDIEGNVLMPPVTPEEVSTPLSEVSEKIENTEATKLDAPCINGSLTPSDAPSPVETPVEVATAGEVLSSVVDDSATPQTATSVSDTMPLQEKEITPKIAPASTGIQKEKVDNKAATKTLKSAKPEGISKPTRTPPPLMGKKSPAKPLESQAKVPLNAKGSSAATKTAAPKPTTAAAARPAPSGKVGATGSAGKSAPSRVATATARPATAPAKTTAAVEAKPGARAAITRAKPTTTTALPASKSATAATTKPAPTSPKRVPSTTTTAKPITISRTGAAQGVSGKPEPKSTTAGAATKLRARPATATTTLTKTSGSTESKVEARKPLVAKTSAPSSAPKPPTTRPTVTRTAPSSARTTAPPKSNASAPSGTNRPPPAKPAPRTVTNVATRPLPAKAPSAPKAPAAAGKKIESGLKGKKPTTVAAKDNAPKPIKSSPKTVNAEKSSLIEQNGVSTKEAEVAGTDVVNGVNGNHNGETDTEKQDPTKENGVHDEMNVTSSTEPIQNLEG